MQSGLGVHLRKIGIKEKVLKPLVQSAAAFHMPRENGQLKQ